MKKSFLIVVFLFLAFINNANAQINCDPFSNLKCWTTAQRPISPSSGATGYNIDLKTIESWNGTSWGPNLLVGPIFIQSYGNVPIQSQFWGYNAGLAYSLSSDSGFGTIGIGAGAFQKLTILGGENVCIGPVAGQMAISVALTTCVGMHALGSQVNGPGFTVFGSDVMRDAIGTAGYITAMGQSSVAHGGPQTITSVGSQSVRGNSAAATLGGTLTNNDVVSLVLTSGVSGLTGLPLTASHTITGGDTLASVALILANQIDQHITGPSYKIGAFVTDMPDGTEVIWFAFPGNTTTGWAITITPHVTGSATETLTVSGGANGNQINAFGSSTLEGSAMQPSVYALSAFGDNAGRYVTTAQYISLFGFNSGQNITSGGADAFYGPLSAPVATTSSNSSGIGFWVFKSLTTGNNETAAGRQACGSLTTGSNVLCLGYLVGSTTLTTGSRDILIGTNNNCDTPLSSTNDYFAICASSGSTHLLTGNLASGSLALVVNGTLTAPSLTTSLTGLAGSLCATVGGLIIYKSGANCF